MRASLPHERLLAIIQTQNEIAATALDLEAVMKLVVDRAAALTGASAAVIELAEGEEMVYHVGSGAAAAHRGLRLRMDSSLSGLCVLRGRSLHCVDASSDDRVDLDACRRVGAMSMVCVPLHHDDQVVGALKVYDPQPGAFSDADVTTLDLLSGVIAAHMVHATDFEEHAHDSRHDSLTAMLNRRAFDARLDEELARIGRHGGQLAVCLLDLDGFKQINDALGHAAGDSVLRAVAANLSQLRDEDSAYRIGGDEFAIVLVGFTAVGAEPVIARIASLIEADADCQGVGISWGIAAFRPGDDAASLLARADAGLYEAKRALAA